jgi:L-phenylalanine/L-methionine N-acetyltransferase
VTATAGVTLRRATVADAEALAVLMADEAVYAGVLQMPYPTADMWRKRLEPQATDNFSLHLIAVASGAVVGSAGISVQGSTPRRRHAGWLGMTVAAEWQGKGIGTFLMDALLDWADNWAGLMRIELTVYTDNARAIALYEKAGFAHEGTHRAYALRAGRFVDAHAMARLHPNPPQLSA